VKTDNNLGFATTSFADPFLKENAALLLLDKLWLRSCDSIQSFLIIQWLEQKIPAVSLLSVYKADVLINKLITSHIEAYEPVPAGKFQNSMELESSIPDRKVGELSLIFCASSGHFRRLESETWFANIAETRLYFPVPPFDLDKPCKIIFSILCTSNQFLTELFCFRLSRSTTNIENWNMCCVVP
jgi:hypothetical protein